MNKPLILSIAGLDPSAGAGLLADIKTAESCGSYCFGVASAITYQNDIEFDGLSWVSLDEIKLQIKSIYKRFKIDYIKIGIIEDLNTLNETCKYLHLLNNDAKIIWDPIIQASAGFTFHSNFDKELFAECLSSIYLITPNLPEFEFIKQIGLDETSISKLCNMLLKGGHSSDDNYVTDLLFQKSEIIKLTSKKIKSDKHGTGCFLSTSISSYLSQNYNLNDAVSKSKSKIEDYIKSNNSHLAYHDYGER